MTEEQATLIRRALEGQHNGSRVDDWLMYGTWLVGGVSVAYFGAHVLAYLVAG